MNKPFNAAILFCLGFKRYHLRNKILIHIDHALCFLYKSDDLDNFKCHIPFGGRGGITKTYKH